MIFGVNAGSGQRKFQTTEEVKWSNIDINSKWDPDFTGDWSDLMHLKDREGNPAACIPEFFDYVVAHHTIEHVGCGEAQGFFREAYRVLKPGGSLIITIPDIRALAKGWLTGRIDEYIYLVNMMGAYMDSEADRHKWHYTFQSLEKELKDAALWLRIQPFNFRPIPGADIANDWWILGVEAFK